MMTPSRIGAHLSTSAGLAAMVRQAVAIGANCVQIFTSSPQQWRGKRYEVREVEAFQQALAETGIGPVVSHDSYLINLASADEVILEKSRQAMREEIARCGQLRLPLLVMHWGAYKGGSLEEGLNRLAKSLNALIPLAEDAGVRIVLETTAGQGTYLGGDFAQYPALFDRIPQHDKLGACLDTCHVFVAGYDLRAREGYERLWQEFDRQVGLSRLKVIHLNDTTRELASHSDRHANLGEGILGEDAFRLLMRDPRLIDVPKILETPGGIEQYARELALLQEFAASAA